MEKLHTARASLLFRIRPFLRSMHYLSYPCLPRRLLELCVAGSTPQEKISILACYSQGSGMAKQRGHGEGSIYQRSDGRWAASLTLEGRKRKTFYGKTRKEVQEKLRIALHEQKQGTLATGQQQTLKQYLEHWLEVHKQAIRLT